MKRFTILIASAIALFGCSVITQPPLEKPPVQTTPTPPVAEPPVAKPPVPKPAPPPVVVPPVAVVTPPPPVVVPPTPHFVPPVIGARINPETLTDLSRDPSGTSELSQLPAFNASIGGKIGAIPVFISLGNPIPLSTLQAFKANGAIPIIDLSCANVESVMAGDYDIDMAVEAATIKEFGSKVYIRWYWEMTSANPKHPECNSYNNGEHFKAAWQHIWKVFQTAGATNVSWVWCPSVRNNFADNYFPGKQFVNVIAADGFVRPGKADTFEALFGDFYNKWAPMGIPIGVGSTGAPIDQQVQFVASMRTALTTQYPMELVVYFDAIGGNGDFRLQGKGLTDFADMLHFFWNIKP